jgi:hypothetical protein
MGTTSRRKYIEIPPDYWTSTINVEYIIKGNNAKAVKRNKKL